MRVSKGAPEQALKTGVELDPLGYPGADDGGEVRCGLYAHEGEHIGASALANGGVGYHVQVEDGPGLDRIYRGVGRVRSTYVGLANLSLGAGLVNRIERVVPVHQQLKYDDRESEEVVVRRAINILESLAYESWGREVVLADYAAMNLSGPRVPGLNRV